MTTTPDPTRDFPEKEIEWPLQKLGGWFGWFGEEPHKAIRALQWKASQGDDLPDDLLLLRNAFAQFGFAPIEEAVSRVQCLEKAFAEISAIMADGPSIDSLPIDAALVQIRTIVESCVKFSGSFGDEEGGSE